jgi:hypothetical protein
MSTQVPPKKNTAFVFYVGLVSQADTKLLQNNPTLAAGDVKVSTDGGTLNNITTLPDAEPDASRSIRVQLSADEMNGDNIVVVFVDAAGAEWCDQIVNIQTAARQVDDLAFPATTGRSLLVDTSGGVSLTTPQGVKKNTQLASFEFAMFNASGVGQTGLTVTATRSIDGAAFAACANAVTEVSSGIYKITLATTDLNGDVITLRFAAAAAQDTLISIKTVSA